MDKKISRFWPVLAIFLLVIGFAFPYWAKDKVPFPADYLVDAFAPWQYYYGLPVKNNAMPDVVTQMFPFKHLVIKLWRSGQIPLWNPYNFAGNPLLANYQSAVFHPANFLFLILSEIDAWSLMILLQPLLAGFFTYLFGRQLKLSQPAALLSAVAFMFCGFMTCWLAYGTLSYALLWLPLILWGIEKIFSDHSGFGLPAVSLGLAASFFSGHFQTSLYVLLGALAYLVFKFWLTREKKVFFLSLLAVVIGVGLAAIQILPSFELYQYSVRSQFLNISEIVPWRHLLTLIAPDFYGNPVTRNDWFGHYAEWAGFIGVIPLLLAIYGAIRRRLPMVRFFALLAMVTLLLTRSTPLLNLIIRLRLPVFSSSAASRIIGLFSFSAAILAGFGFDQLQRDLKKKQWQPAAKAFGLALGLALLTWAALVVFKPLPPEWLPVAKRNFILPTTMMAVTFGLVVAFWLVSKFLKIKKIFNVKFEILILVALLALSVFDIFRFAHKWMPFDSREHVYPSLPILEFLTKTIGDERPVNEAGRLFGYFGMEVMNYYQIPGFTGYDPLYIQRYGELMLANNEGKIGQPSGREVRFEKRGQHTLELLNLLGGKYHLHARADNHYVWAFPFWDYPDQFKLIYEDDQYHVYENLDVFPRAFLAYDYKIATGSQAVADAMFAPETDLAQTVILEEEPTVQPTAPEIPGTVEILGYSPNKVVLRAQTGTPALLFLSDNCYPGWQATVNGQPTKIFRANYSFRAISIPVGDYQVEFNYQPFSFKLGLGISLGSLAGLLFLSVCYQRKKR